MKLALLAFVALVIWIVVVGSPLVGQQPERGNYYGSPEPILPMTFAHGDHQSVNCVDCHHNYVDDTGQQQCMICHVSQPNLLLAIEQQFHDLCRGCHESLVADGHASGPPRQCIACHTHEQVP